MADIWLTLSISQNSQSIPNNTSNVTVIVYANWNYNYYNHNKKAGTLTIDGTSYSFSAPFNTSNKTNGGSEELFRKTVNVSHNSNGAKTLSVSASYATGIIGTISKSASKTLTTIPRATAPTVSASSVAMGSSVTISMPRASSAFTHTLTYKLGSASGTIGSSLATSASWTPPLSLASQLPSATSGTATITCNTYNGSSLIGTKTTSLTVSVPSSVVPTISGANISEAVSAVTNAFGNKYIQNLSQLNVSVNASGAYGSTIKSYQTSLDGVNYIQQAFTSNVIKTAGTQNITVKVTDSRNRTAQSTFTVDVVEYIKPTITSMVYERCDSDGTQNSSGTSTKVTIAGVVYPVDGQNTKALKLKYRSMADEVYTERALTISDWTFSVDTIINNTDPTVTYEYIAELTDKINADSPETFRVTTGVPVLSRLAGGKGLTLFEEAQKEGFFVGGGKSAYFKTGYGSGDDETALLNSLIEVGGGRKRFSSSSATGIMKIVLPQDLTSAAMVAFDVEIFSYTKQTLATYSFGGQIYRSATDVETGGNWGYRTYNVQGSSLSSTGLANLQINFGRHNGKAAVSMGLADTKWGFCTITVKNVRTYYNSKWRAEYWSNGWDIVLDTNPLDTIMNTYDNPASKALTSAGVADYIVGVGEYTQSSAVIYSWEKYASGKVKILIRLTTTFTAKNASGYGYYTDQTLTIPDDVPLVSGSIIDCAIRQVAGNGLASWHSSELNDKTIGYRNYSSIQSTSATQKTLRFDVTGRWK